MYPLGVASAVLVGPEGLGQGPISLLIVVMRGEDHREEKRVIGWESLEGTHV